MFAPNSSPDPLARRANELAEENRWDDLHELLSSTDRERVVGGRTLAARFGEALLHTDRIEDLAGFADEVEAAARERCDIPSLLWALAASGNAAFQLGETDTARARYDRLVELAEAEENDEMLAKGFNNLGALSDLRGDPERALSYFQRAQPLYERLDQATGVAQLKHNQAISYRNLGRLRDAVDTSQQATELARNLDHRPLVVISVLGRIETELRRGQVEFCQQLLERVTPDVEAAQNPVFEAEALRLHGLVRAAAEPPELEAALSDVDDALTRLEPVRRPLVEAEVRRDTAGILRSMDRTSEAAEHLRRAVEIFEAIGAEKYAREAQEALDSLSSA